MAISLMAARLFENAFRNLDFTGWPEFKDFGYTKSAHMMLSIDKKDMNIWSVMVNSRKTDDGIGYTFTLIVEQTHTEIKDGRYQFLVQDIAIHEVRGLRKIGIAIGKGQDIILDVLDRPAYKPEDDIQEEEEEDGDVDDSDCIICPECGFKNDQGHRVCRQCGNPLELDSEIPTEEEESEEEDEEPEDPEPEETKPSWRERRAIKKINKRTKKDLLSRAKRNKAPKGKTSLSKHRKP